MKQTISNNPDTARATSPDQPEQSGPIPPRAEYGMIVVARVILLIGGVIMALIALRIALSLLGANQDNAFASFIYDVSLPFVAPFFGLFNYTMRYGVSRFEFESLIALVAWGLLASILARLVTIGTKTP